MINPHLAVEPKHIARTVHNTKYTKHHSFPAHTERCFSFWDICFLCECLTRWPEFDTAFFRNIGLLAMPGGSEGSVDRLCDLCDGLRGTLAEADMLGRRCKRRSGILRTLFRLIDLDSAQLNLHIAELCLAVSRLSVPVRLSACHCVPITGAIWGTWALSIKVVPSFFFFQLCVSGNNLLNICKLIFQISRRESNDILFQNSSVIGELYSRSQSC